MVLSDPKATSALCRMPPTTTELKVGEAHPSKLFSQKNSVRI